MVQVLHLLPTMWETQMELQALAGPALAAVAILTIWIVWTSRWKIHSLMFSHPQPYLLHYPAFQINKSLEIVWVFACNTLKFYETFKKQRRCKSYLELNSLNSVEGKQKKMKNMVHFECCLFKRKKWWNCWELMELEIFSWKMLGQVSYFCSLL